MKTKLKRGLWLAPCIALAMGFAVPSAQAVTIYGLTDGGTASNKLISFDSATPGTLLTGPTAISGLGAEKIIGIDFRPADGKLYAVSDGNKVYTINPTTGGATALTLTGVLFGTFAGTDFDPVAGDMRYITNNSNFTIAIPTPATAAATQQGNLTYVAPDPNAGNFPLITGVAYTNTFTTAATTSTLYGIDRGPVAPPAPGTATPAVLVRVGDVDQSAPTSANAGTGALHTVGALGFTPASGNVGFDIVGATTAYAAFTDITTGTTNLYTVNLTSGAATAVGPIGTGATAVAGIAAVLTAAAPPAADTVQFSAGNYNVTEGPGAVATITVTRTAGSTTPATVTVTTSDGTALATSDYTATTPPVTLTFAPGDVSKTVSVPITDDANVEPTETFNVTLTAGAGATLGTQNPATVTITDNDTVAGGPGPNQVEFNNTVSTIRENRGSIALTVTRTGDTTGVATVDYGTIDGTAMAGADYTATSGTLSFAAGETTKTITVPVLKDTVKEPSETFNVILFNPVGVALGANDTNTVTITKKKSGGGCSLSLDPAMPDPTLPVLVAFAGLYLLRRRLGWKA